MSISASQIESLIRQTLPDARVIIHDLSSNGDHLSAEVTSESFRGKTRVEQHKMIYEALKELMGGDLHALALQTSVPEK